ncbi:hypothetical protein [Labrys sp. ZIDIC5]|uniref:hypothetical protein n=1 Tax=Labrys sedimenti TaxID=3106036 RepID=UPI002ACA17D0|nr:hypothetical protein [Labrys sp. ZIDIC5]MDZ5448904.1 hypothetical protein [Labrys sp. ZIDIC5]
MSQISTLLKLASAFADQRKLSESRVSTLVFGDGTRLNHLRQGGDMGSRRVERAIQWFSDNWPEIAPWPTDVLRPVALSPAEVAA